MLPTIMNHILMPVPNDSGSGVWGWPVCGAPLVHSGKYIPVNVDNKLFFQDCVKTKALYSVLAVRQIGKAEAVNIIEKVFPKCYADLEPIGRRIRRNSEDMYRAFREASYYGYE